MLNTTRATFIVRFLSTLCVLAGLAISNGVYGGIIYTDPVDVTIGAIVGQELRLNLNNDAFDDFAIDFVDDGTNVFSEEISVTALDDNSLMTDGTHPFRLAASGPISQFRLFESSAQLEGFGGSGPWEGGGTGYLGLRLDLFGGGPFNYGWAQITYDDAANEITLLDYAYETDADVGILAGAGAAATAAVPEPTTNFTIAFAFAGFCLRRRWRNSRGVAG